MSKVHRACNQIYKCALKIYKQLCIERKQYPNLHVKFIQTIFRIVVYFCVHSVNGVVSLFQDSFHLNKLQIVKTSFNKHTQIINWHHFSNTYNARPKPNNNRRNLKQHELIK
jgi:hypothetical protein